MLGWRPCPAQGGSLVTYRSLALQQEIENYYIDQGLLLPVYHKVWCYAPAPSWGIAGVVPSLPAGDPPPTNWF